MHEPEDGKVDAPEALLGVVTAPFKAVSAVIGSAAAITGFVFFQKYVLMQLTDFYFLFLLDEQYFFNCSLFFVDAVGNVVDMVVFDDEVKLDTISALSCSFVQAVARSKRAGRIEDQPQVCTTSFIIIIVVLIMIVIICYKHDLNYYYYLFLAYRIWP